MLKICPICQKEFNSTPQRRKFCSDRCRIQSDYARHNKWTEENQYFEKKRKYKAQVKQEEINIQREYLQKLHEDRLKQIEADKVREQKELEERAKAGEYKALMQLAPDRKTYLKYFALDEIESSEKYGYKSTREINGISVYDPDFAELVLKSIEETGRYLCKEHGLGEKISR